MTGANWPGPRDRSLRLSPGAKGPFCRSSHLQYTQQGMQKHYGIHVLFGVQLTLTLVSSSLLSSSPSFF
jgi:hypothetical protein